MHTLRRRYGHAARLPFHGGDCYACASPAKGFRDRRPEGGVLERACSRHLDPHIKTYEACMYCDGPVRKGSVTIDRDFAHKSCQESGGEKHRPSHRIYKTPTGAK